MVRLENRNCNFHEFLRLIGWGPIQINDADFHHRLHQAMEISFQFHRNDLLQF